MSKNIAIVLLLALLAIAKAEAIGATLEPPTIKDMYFGFCMAGLLADRFIYTDQQILDESERLSNLMMKRRGK